MSKKFKSQASSARAASAAFGASSFGVGSLSGGFRSAVSSLSYITEQPDLSGVSNPNIVVALRNLTKKDSTTKAKALEELQEYISSVSSAEQIDPGLLEAWVGLYPRTSIDNSRRVRQLAHTIQGTLTATSGRRIAPHLSKVIGSWLSGAYDSDKLVARVAQESISTAFTTEDRRRALWKVYKEALIEYAEDAILVQTPSTLSDERSTTPDDAEAKFVRVVGNAIYMLCQVLRNNFSGPADGNAAALPERLEQIVTDKRLWEYSYSEDPNLRKAICALVIVCTETVDAYLDWPSISACFIGKALHNSQLGSSRQLSEALLALTGRRPEIWTSDYSSKTPASKRLHQYLKNGSQRGPADFWVAIAALLKRIPLEVWAPEHVDRKVDLPSATRLIGALRAGITSPEEPRQNLQTAWLAYVEISFWILDMLRDDDSKTKLMNEELVPLVTQYIAHDMAQTSGKLPASCDLRIATSILVSVLRHGLHDVFESAWLRVCEELSNAMKLSLPETSKDFSKSQDSVTAQAQRLFQLRSSVLKSGGLGPVESSYAVRVFQQGDEKLLGVATELLRSRNGKPYSAAFVLERVVVDPHSPTPQWLEDFLTSDAMALLNSPSAEYIITIILNRGKNIEQIVSNLIHSADSGYAISAISRLLSQVSEETLSNNPELEAFVLHKTSSALEEDAVQRMARAILRNPKLRLSNFWESCFKCILGRLSSDRDAASQQVTLHFLLDLFSGPDSALAISNSTGGELLSRSLLLSDSQNSEIADLAKLLIEKIRSAPSGQDTAASTSAKVITDQLSGTGVPLSIFTLIDLAKDTFKNTAPDQAGSVAALLPSASQWVGALQGHISGKRPRSLVVTNPLHGIVFMLEQGNVQQSTHNLRDADEFSLLFRLVLYVTRMASDTHILPLLPAEQLGVLYFHYPLALQLVNEKLTMESANDIWQNTSNEVIEEAADVLSQGNSLVQKWIQDDGLINTWINAIRSTADLTPESYLKGLAFTDIASRYVDEFGPSRITSSFDIEMKEMYNAPEVTRSASLICACRDQIISGPSGRRLLNELIAMGTELKSEGSVAGLRSLVLLDLLLDGRSKSLEEIPSQRLIFFVQTLTRLLTDKSDDLGYQTEAMRLLDPVLSAVKDVYGPHWERILTCLLTLWHDGHDLADNIPLLHASLRLYARLRSLAASDDSNDDVRDSWEAAQASLEDGLVRCLHIFKDPKEEMDQPRQIAAEMLRRQLLHISLSHDAELYSFLSSREPAIRGAAYDLLHRSIPAQQEQFSLELALEHRITHLPDELLSLLSNTTGSLELGPGSNRQTYLLRWQLIFDHFTKASYKLREMYTSDIKEGHVLPRLLEVICDICRVTGSRPLDASKVDLETFELGPDDLDEKGEQRLSMHLYYCCLLYLPSLTRGWFLEQKNRVKLPLESWTQKFFSPSLIAAAIRTVTEWVANQPEDDSEASVNAKASVGGSEIVASVAVDPESPPITLAISLPATYPLDSPSVSSRTRVGVSEKNWQSWLRTFQIIIFSTGSIIEGLIAFRRNVQGALKGQSECAICYSIIGTDMQTPNKRCGTCRNTFHGTCLFRWFKSSNSSSCPLCRNNFNYA
ncbi:hypothetical protein A1O1_03299 [Capronia coronata CBS 617.96]|uniref:E3 ubiquitin-protein ligase listerin n=1 Tax=Capronia coronata CBS 617.96 TaxID=1182541 RepID=W9YKI3_9EURO|nr:uncharacterized protein A1O1_03299 [Capronia coronata CBS 617.96]EXJ90200.1 hypothetical protein A1O1_03299 [Capronia coronata CBS 617.96]